MHNLFPDIFSELIPPTGARLSRNSAIRNHSILSIKTTTCCLPMVRVCCCLSMTREYPLGGGITYTYNYGGGLSMAWMGMTDKQFRSGYMTILETPFDAALRTKRQADGLITFAPVWLSSLEEFGYDRKVTYHFFNEGGYVAQCKKYREYIWPKNQVKTLKENLKRFPTIDNMVGAPHIYVWDTGRDLTLPKN